MRIKEKQHLYWASVLIVVLASIFSLRIVSTSDGKDRLVGECSIKIETDLSCDTFVKHYLGKEPVVIRNRRDAILRNDAFVEQSQLETLRERYKSLPVKISTANAFTGRDWKEMTLFDYLDRMLGPQQADKHGNETFYLFGSQYGDQWDDFLSIYRPPTLRFPSESFLGVDVCDASFLKRQTETGVSLSFGVAGRGTGVPFHFHGPGFLQMLHGRKRWFLYPPKTKPMYDPNVTVLTWLETQLEQMENPPTHDCVLEPLDVIYFPNEWMHATLNIDPFTCFIASFA